MSSDTRVGESTTSVSRGRRGGGERLTDVPEVKPVGNNMVGGLGLLSSPASSSSEGTDCIGPCSGETGVLGDAICKSLCCRK